MTRRRTRTTTSALTTTRTITTTAGVHRLTIDGININDRRQLARDFNLNMLVCDAQKTDEPLKHKVDLCM